MRAGFTVEKSKQAELSAMVFRASISNIQSSAQLSFGYGMVRPVTNRNKWTLFV